MQASRMNYSLLKLKVKVGTVNSQIQHGVLNMEMEANVFLSFCNRLKIPGAVVCCSIVNRLKGDQITSTKEFLKAIERYPLAMILQVNKLSVGFERDKN